MPDLILLKARYVFPVSAPPIRDGLVTIDGERIVRVGSDLKDGPIRDLGNVAILPGLINAHTHLELSDLTQPLGYPGIGFVDWVKQLVAYRFQRTATPAEAVETGLQESASRGVTALGEIAQPGWPIASFDRARLDATVFLELIAPTTARVDAALELARQHLARRERIAGGEASTPGVPQSWRPGLSPHAPYSVHPELLAAVAQISAAQRVPIAFHLAESREELEFLRSGTGPLRDFLNDLGAWEPGGFSTGQRPLDYLHALAPAHRTLVIHGNYLDDEEIAFLAAHADHMAVAYCPRTHDWFQHAAYPLERLVSSGATVALGTDSRASSPDLSLLAEMRRVATKHPRVPGHAVLRLGTLGGAQALGIADAQGSLEPGKRANLTVVALPEHEASDPHELLFDSHLPVVR
jgi:cytosine/adenosine deaminase-related metal-dependent hydrolase